MGMADVTHSPSQVSGGPESAAASTNQSSSASSMRDSLDEKSGRDRLASLSVHLISCANLRAATVTEKSIGVRRIYAKVFIDPGDQCATSKALTIEYGSSQVTWDETIALQGFSLACISLLANVALCDLVVEIWEIGSSESSHEIVGSSRIAMQKVVERLTSEPLEAVLVRRSGRGFAGKITLNATIEADSSNLTPFSSSLLAGCVEDKNASGKGTLVVTVVACNGLEVSLLALDADLYILVTIPRISNNLC